MLNAVDISTTQTSAPTSVINMDKAGIYFEWSGTSPVGVLTVEARNSSDGNWYTLDFGSAMNISGNTGSHQIRITELLSYEIRVKYTATSGTGTATATIVMKQVGG
jgi:hypothetical protein